TQVRLAELKGVVLNTIPYPHSNTILTQYQEEIRNLEKKTNYQSEIDSIDKLADWLAGPEKDHKPKESESVPTTFDEWVDKHLWLGKEDPKLSPNANKPHITYEYTNKIRNLMDDDEEYIIGIVNSLKEEWVPEEKQEWKMESHGWIPSFNEYSNGKINIHKLLIMDQRAWLSWKDENIDSNKDGDYYLEGQPYVLRYQFMACSCQDLFGPGIHKDGTVWWHTQLPVHVHHNMILEIRSFLYYATEYTLFTKIWKSDRSVDEEIADKGWHFDKKKKAGSLTGEEITPEQLIGIDQYL
ncbi:6653_t:CDS:2, partial [Ambispora leptoticha]